jgi:hypothetical protein
VRLSSHLILGPTFLECLSLVGFTQWKHTLNVKDHCFLVLQHGMLYRVIIPSSKRSSCYIGSNNPIFKEKVLPQSEGNYFLKKVSTRQVSWIFQWIKCSGWPGVLSKPRLRSTFALHGPLILKGQGGPICSAHLPIFLVGSIGFKIWHTLVVVAMSVGEAHIYDKFFCL